MDMLTSAGRYLQFDEQEMLKSTPVQKIETGRENRQCSFFADWTLEYNSHVMMMTRIQCWWLATLFRNA